MKRDWPRPKPVNGGQVKRECVRWREAMRWRSGGGGVRWRRRGGRQGRWRRRWRGWPCWRGWRLAGGRCAAVPNAAALAAAGPVRRRRRRGGGRPGDGGVNGGPACCPVAAANWPNAAAWCPMNGRRRAEGPNVAAVANVLAADAARGRSRVAAWC